MPFSQGTVLSCKTASTSCACEHFRFSIVCAIFLEGTSPCYAQLLFLCPNGGSNSSQKEQGCQNTTPVLRQRIRPTLELLEKPATCPRLPCSIPAIFSTTTAIRGIWHSAPSEHDRRTLTYKAALAFLPGSRWIRPRGWFPGPSPPVPIRTVPTRSPLPPAMAAAATSQTTAWIVNPYPVTLTNPGKQTNYQGNAVYTRLSAQRRNR